MEANGCRCEDMMPDTSSLNSVVQRLSQSVDWWNNAIIYSLVFAAVAAIAVGITTYAAFKKASKLANAQGALAEAKDTQLQIDLRNKDLQIANANQTASEANEKAKKAEANLAEANERAAKAQEEAAKANLELERIRTPRTLRAEDITRLSTELKPFSGTPYDLAVGGDMESINFMRQVQSALKDAGWVQVAAKGPIGISDSDPLIGLSLNSGVYVEIAQSKLSEWLAPVTILVGDLKQANVPAQGNAAEKGADPNAVHIYIGTKPR